MEVRRLINNYAYSEVLDVIDNMEEKYKDLLPEKLIQFLNEIENFEYQKHVIPNISLSKQNISKDAITILAIINLKYWVKDENHKAELIEKYKMNNNEISNEELKNIFESDNSENNNTTTNEPLKNDVNKSIVVKEYSFMERIKNWFLKVIKKSPPFSS